MPVATDDFALEQLALFHHLTPEQLVQIKPLLHRKSFPAGATIITVEQPGEVIYIIESGAVKIHVEQVDGTDVILAILGAGDVFGEMSLMEATARSANAVTLEDSVLWWMDQAAFHRCLDTIPQLANNLLRLLSQRLRLANEQIQALATKDVESRVARQLLALVKSYGHQTENGDWHLPIRLTQSDLACLIGATRERVNQVMASYQQRRYLSSDKKHHLTLHNLPALMKRLQRSE